MRREAEPDPRREPSNVPCQRDLSPTQDQASSQNEPVKPIAVILGSHASLSEQALVLIGRTYPLRCSLSTYWDEIDRSRWESLPIAPTQRCLTGSVKRSGHEKRRNKSTIYVCSG